MIAKAKSKIAKSFVVSTGPTHQLVCSTTLPYTPDSMKHKYGKSARPCVEEWFLTELEFFKRAYPGYDIFTLGSSLVFGERFVTYATVCEFELESLRDLAKLKKALRDSDLAIRKKWAVLWAWNIAAVKDRRVSFMVGFMDFAYFLKYREEFRNAAHGRYMRSFVGDKTVIRSKDYKVLHDGKIVLFDQSKLDKKDRRVFDRCDEIEFKTVSIEKGGAQ